MNLQGRQFPAIVEAAFFVIQTAANEWGAGCRIDTKNTVCYDANEHAFMESGLLREKQGDQQCRDCQTSGRFPQYGKQND